jgi:hypothetical protein
MVARRVLFIVTVLVAALTTAQSPAGGLTPDLSCPGRPLVNVSYLFANDQLLGLDGEVWAVGSGYGQFRLYPAGAGAFCAVSTVAGTFTTFAGPSPAGTGTVPAGITGYLVGTNVLRFTGDFAPKLPTRGFVGSFDARCDQFECETPIQFGRNYVDVNGPPEVLGYRFVHVSRCGVWIETSTGSQGDIAC